MTDPTPPVRRVDTAALDAIDSVVENVFVESAIVDALADAGYEIVRTPHVRAVEEPQEGDDRATWLRWTIDWIVAHPGAHQHAMHEVARNAARRDDAALAAPSPRPSGLSEEDERWIEANRAGIEDERVPITARWREVRLLAIIDAHLPLDRLSSQPTPGAEPETETESGRGAGQ